jgi:hypothetical protein
MCNLGPFETFIYGFRLHRMHISVGSIETRSQWYQLDPEYDTFRLHCFLISSLPGRSVVSVATMSAQGETPLLLLNPAVGTECFDN